MANENLNNNLESARIDQLPKGNPQSGDLLVYRDMKNGVTRHTPVDVLFPQAPTQNFEWVSGKNPAYNEDEVVTRRGLWYQSTVDNNTSIPGESSTWQILDRGNTGGFWKAGVYSEDKPIVYSDHTGTTEIYQLVNATRPYKSVDIEAEIAAGDWEIVVGRVRLMIVDTSGDVITFNMRNQSQAFFKGSDNIDEPTLWIFENDDNLVNFKFRFIIASLDSHRLPENVKMSDTTFDNSTKIWKPIDIGEYEARGFFDGEEYLLEIYGPYLGGGNIAPQVIGNEISLVNGVLDGPRAYFDAEGDLENNPPPQVIGGLWLTGTPIVGNILTLDFEFYSPMGYDQGPNIIKWYRRNPDTFEVFEIVGETDVTYTVTQDDVNMEIYASLIVTQVADPPANGNPNSVLNLSNTLLGQSEVIPDVLELTQYYDTVVDVADYDVDAFLIPDTGLNPKGNWSTPTSANRPDYSAVDDSLDFDRTIPDYINGTVIGSSIKGGSGVSRTWEMCGVFETDDNSLSGSNNQSIWAINSSAYMRIDGTNIIVGNSGEVTFAANIQANTKYSWRLIAESVGGFLQLTLQLNYDEDTDTFGFEDTLTLGSNGVGWADNQVIYIGTNHLGTSRAFDGKIYAYCLLTAEHIPTDKEVELWRNLNAR